MEPTKVGRLVCAKCRASGTVTCAVLTDRRLRLERLSAGFLYVDRGRPGDPHCECATCKVPVSPPDWFSGERLSA